MKNLYNLTLTELSKFSAGGKPVSDLSRFAALCEVLGNPQNDLKFIHIAGTNGKGSVSEYISRALVDAGYKTGKFTSPYIFNIRERIQLQNRLITEKDFAESVTAAITAARNLKGTGDYSQFEILTAACFIYYKKKKADIVVLETGIGGSLDCTNIITPESCVISVITAVDYDHADILGLTLSEIAAHKAGIIKQNGTCVMYPLQGREAYVEIKTRAEKQNAVLIIPDTDALSNVKPSIYGNSFAYKGEEYKTIMGGSHQINNAITAIETLKALDIETETKAIKYGLKTAQIPGRLQIIRKNPLIIIDGAHNRQSIAAAKAAFSDDWRVRKSVVFGCISGKDYLGALEELSTFAHSIVFTDGFSENAVSCSDLYRAATLFGFDGGSVFTVSRAKKALELASDLCGGGAVLVTGSLRLVGEVGL